MAGIAAAHRLQSSASSCFSLTILEASDRIGGRIWSREFGRERVELGALWIHGIDGSPIFELASHIGAMDSADQPWEGQDGFLHHGLLRTEDGEDVDEKIVAPVEEFFNDLLTEMKDEQSRAPRDQTVGEFLRNRFCSFLADQQCAAKSAQCPWSDEKLLQAEAVFRSKEYLERIVTSADSLSDLDMTGYQEYKQFGGEDRTIAKGYSTVLRELSRVLPDGAIQYKKKVEKIVWDQEGTTSVYPVTVVCEDGSVEQADHVILTVSLGVLKQATLPPSVNNRATFIEEKVGDDAVIAGSFFDPPLPVWKLDPIAKLGFGVVNKLFVEIEPGNGRVHKPLRLIFKTKEEEQKQEELAAAAAPGGCPQLLRKCFSIHPINKMSHVLVIWFVGREALQSELQTYEDIVKGITDMLKAFHFPHGVCKGLARSNYCLLEKPLTGIIIRPSTVLTLANGNKGRCHVTHTEPIHCTSLPYSHFSSRVIATRARRSTRYL
ncbi:hypothetical protein R1flu_018401 [Riccia fluitans]|uniref:Amine oxidase domain-containing protein n=1 Tax=Riccia fluitans TaxID=41844 RepID=A0ABD1ZFR3_9MARC